MKILNIIICILFLCSTAYTNFIPDRRRDLFFVDFGYFLYPVYGQVPGIGSGYGAGATVVNMFNTDIDITAVGVTGDLKAYGLGLFNIHLVPKTLLLHSAYYYMTIPQKIFTRGNESSKDNYLYLQKERKALITQLRLCLWERRLESFLTLSWGDRTLKKITNENEIEFEPQNPYTRAIQNIKYGVLLDFTDDHYDPRRGLRLEWQHRQPLIENKYMSKYNVDDFNFSAYIPILGISTIALNHFYSASKVMNSSTTDRGTLQNELALKCSDKSGTARTECENAQNQLIDERIERNRLGRATSLGGVQFARAYPIERFYAAYAKSYGAELRLNFFDKPFPFNIYIMKGLRTSIQFAFFTEAGAVAETASELNSAKLHCSYGTAFRMIFSGATIRCDIAWSEEGHNMTLLFDYPWMLLDFTD